MMDPYDHVDVWLNAVQDLLVFYSEAVVANFYDTLMRAEASAQILSLLSDAEMAHLKTCQVRYLTQVLSPGLSQEQHMSMASSLSDLAHDCRPFSPRIFLKHLF
jgi:hypothetical protein